ncbi:MAG: hypothetical protein WBZ00_01250 [Solirubrobacterales bacterium]
MADLMPRIRMPKVTLPGRSDSAGSPRDKAAAANKPTAEARTKPPTGAQEAEASTTEGTRESAKEPTKGDEPEPNLQERMEGLQARMAEIERKQGRLTYFGIAGIVLALVAGGAALYIGLAAKNDSATKGDVDALTKKVDALQAAATKNSKETQNALNASAAQLQASISALQRQQSQNAASIATLQSQATAGAFGKGAAAGKTPGAALTPGATTTTTPKKP